MSSEPVSDTRGNKPVARRSLLANSAIMASGSLASKILGLARMTAVMAVLGAGLRTETFQMALALPTIIYYLIAGGALNTILVPQIVKAIENDDDGGEAYTNRIITLFLSVVAATTLVCLVATPWLLRILIDGEWFAPERAAQLNDITTMAYITMPQILLYGLFFIFSQVLNAREYFGPMMWAPVANNVVLLTMLAGFGLVWAADADAPMSAAQTWWLAGGATLGILVQFLILVPSLRKAGVRYRPRFDFRRTGLGSTLELGKWVFGLVVITQLVTLVMTRLATSAVPQGGGEGAGLTVYNFAFVIYMLPHGMITVTLGTALMPAISRFAARQDWDGVGRETMRLVRLSATLIVPCGVAMAVLAPSIIALLFRWGAANSSPAVMDAMGWTIAAYGLTLPFYAVSYALGRTQLALERARSLFWISVVMDVINIVLAWAAVAVIGVGPLWVAPALAASLLVAHVPAVLLWFRSFRVGTPPIPHITLSDTSLLWLKLLVASLPMAAIGWWLRPASTVEHGRLEAVWTLAAAGVPGMLLFLVVARLLRVQEVTEMVAMVRSRLPGGRAAAPAGVAEPEPVQRRSTREAVSWDPQPREEDAEAVTDHPDSPQRHLTDTLEDQARISAVVPGQMLGERYRMDSLLVRRGTTVTWRAFDTVLSRDVLVHLLAPQDPRSEDVLTAARRAARVTDARFLRVLDAVHSPADQLGSYIVCEFAPGRNLEQQLVMGPISPLVAGWVAREVADALAGAHANGMHHERLSPDTVVLTRTGGVKIVGFMIDRVLSPEVAPSADPEGRDVDAVGAVLYAGLVGRWPGGQAYGMPAAPTDGQGVLSPRQVRPGVPPALDDVVDRILGAPPRRRGQPLRSARDIAFTLTHVLGGADAAGEIEALFREPGQPVDPHPPAVRRSAPTPAPVPTPSPAVAAAEPARRPDSVRRAAAAPEPQVRAPGKPWLLWLLVVAASVILIALAVQRLVAQPTDTPAPAQTPAVSASTEPGTQAALPIVRGYDFDPQGSKQETPAELPLAFDGKATTAWHTETYKVATMTDSKEGVGFIADLGEARDVSKVSLRLTGEPSSFTVMVPRDAADADKPPLDSVEAWVEVARLEDASTTPDAALSQTARTRYVLVWFTMLPKLDNGFFQQGIQEMRVF